MGQVYVMEAPSSYKESTPTSILSPLRTSLPSKKHKKKPSLFKRITAEWSTFVTKIKALSEAAFSEDEVVDELFEDDGDAFDRFLRSNFRTTNKADEQFLNDFKVYKSLDKLYEAKSSKTSKNFNTDTPQTMDVVSVDDLASKNLKFQDLDMVKLRDELETRVKTAQIMSDTLTDSSGRGLAPEVPKQNIGETLWEYRRAQWLATEDGVDAGTKLEERAARLSIKHIPKELYPRIYSNFVEKSKPLKADKRINLEDLINIINAGWISDEKWERAAKGLA